MEQNLEMANQVRSFCKIYGALKQADAPPGAGTRALDVYENTRVQKRKE